MQSFGDVIALWPSPDAMAEAIGLKAETVRKWRQRDSIPSDYWQLIIEAARESGKPLTADALARIAAKPLPAPAEAAP